MPLVRSYYRRQAGSASLERTTQQRTLHVAIYDAATGSDLLRARSGIKVANVRFSTGFPGGFLDCSFSAMGATAKVAGIDTGQKVIVRLGRKIVWWGWIEDIQRSQQGRLVGLAVSCLGAWQNCQQRIVQSFIGGSETASAIKSLLVLYCERISTDHSHIDATGVTSDPDAALEFTPVARIITDACDIGNSSNQTMLFAIWEPNETHLETLTPSDLAVNGSFETGAGTAATGWTLTRTERSSLSAIDGSYSMIQDVTTGSSGTCVSTDYITVTALQNYVLSMSYKTHIISGDSVILDALASVEVHWYNSVPTLLSTTTYTAGTDYANATSNWQQFLKTATAPASATQAKLEMTLGVGAPLTNLSMIDDVAFYEIDESGGTEAHPIPWFWARDLSTYDYMIYTTRLKSPWQLTETTRQLANAVWAQYQDTYTDVAQDSTSQTAYRRRDVVIDAGDFDVTSATGKRDTYLARWKDPTDEPSNLTANRLTVLNKRGLPVNPLLLRAGHRIKIMDGVRAGTIIMLKQTSYSDGVMQLTPEQETSATNLLARIV